MRKRVIYYVYKSLNAQRMRKKCAKSAQKKAPLRRMRLKKLSHPMLELSIPLEVDMSDGERRRSACG